MTNLAPPARIKCAIPLLLEFSVDFQWLNVKTIIYTSIINT